MITIDGVEYKATWLQGFEQTADILNGENSGRLQATGKMHLEYIGTYFNHKGDLRRDADCSDDEWEALFQVLARPVNKHTGIFPFGVNQVLEQEVYISQVVRRLVFIKETNRWEKVYSVTFTAISPAWLPGGNIKGLK